MYYCVYKSHQVYANIIASVFPISLLLIRELIVHKLKCNNEFLLMEFTGLIIFPITLLNAGMNFCRLSHEAGLIVTHGAGIISSLMWNMLRISILCYFSHTLDSWV